ncbi:hypothetical protein PR048_033097, partial [Dryococelus australis]
IKKAYRQKALTCHPDKHPDNPKAAELFHELSKALEILLDEAARVSHELLEASSWLVFLSGSKSLHTVLFYTVTCICRADITRYLLSHLALYELLAGCLWQAAYDAVQKAKADAKQRRRNLDSRYKKLREDLEEREKKAQEEDMRFRNMNFDYMTSEDKLERSNRCVNISYDQEVNKVYTRVATAMILGTLSEACYWQAEIERLRKEGSRHLKEEQEAVRQQLLREASVRDAVRKTQPEGSRLRIQWQASKDDPTNGGYDYATLHSILSKVSPITEYNFCICSTTKLARVLCDW